MRWLRYFWRVAVNCFYMVVIGYVFKQLEHKPEIVTIAVLGLIYVVIRTIAIGQYLVSINQVTFLNKQLLIVRKLLHDPQADVADKEWLEEVEPTVARKRV